LATIHTQQTIQKAVEAMLDYKQLEAYEREVLFEIHKALAEDNVVKAKILKDCLVEQFIAYIAKDFGVHMCCPDYITRIAKNIAALKPIEVTIAP
jgi:hypothetical protein